MKIFLRQNGHQKKFEKKKTNRFRNFICWSFNLVNLFFIEKEVNNIFNRDVFFITSPPEQYEIGYITEEELMRII